jgi:hypothetical protein
MYKIVIAFNFLKLYFKESIYFVSDSQIIELEEVTSEIFFTLATIIVRFEFCRKFNESGGLSRVKIAMERHCTLVYYNHRHIMNINMSMITTIISFFFFKFFY